MADLSIRSEGQRHYVVGDTYPVKDLLRAAGLKWDAQEKAWYSGRREVANAALAAAAGANGSAANVAVGGNGAAKQDHPAPGIAAVVAGRATYKGRTYYVAGRERRGRTRYDDSVVQVESRDGSRVLLYFRDGSSQFWADRGAVEIAKAYRKPQTIGSLREFVEQAKQARAQGYEDGIPDGRRYECEECGERVTRGDGSTCWETGCAH